LILPEVKIVGNKNDDDESTVLLGDDDDFTRWGSSQEFQPVAILRHRNDDEEASQMLYTFLQEEMDNMCESDDNNKPFDDFYEPFCIDCNKEPCVWYQNCKAMRRLDRENVTRRGLSNFPNDGNKTRRYPLYRRMALIQWGRYVARKRHPRCVEDGVRNIAPDPNKAYTGFQG
jgi:hypothetical protein